LRSVGQVNAWCVSRRASAASTAQSRVEVVRELNRAAGLSRSPGRMGSGTGQSRGRSVSPPGTSATSLCSLGTGTSAPCRSTTTGGLTSAVRSRAGSAVSRNKPGRWRDRSADRASVCLTRCRAALHLPYESRDVRRWNRLINISFAFLTLGVGNAIVALAAFRQFLPRHGHTKRKLLHELGSDNHWNRKSG
jgi:hypothetical protein